MTPTTRPTTNQAVSTAAVAPCCHEPDASHSYAPSGRNTDRMPCAIHLRGKTSATRCIHVPVLLTRPPDPSLEIEPILAEAVDRVRGQGIRGQAVTPAVLDLVHEMSGGRSIEVNRQLIADNAGLAAEVAVAYAGQD